MPQLLERQFVAADGSGVTVRSLEAKAREGEPEKSEYSCVTSYSISGNIHEFVATGHQTSGAQAMQGVYGVTPTELYGSVPGRVRIGSQTFTDPDANVTNSIRVAVWEGTNSSILTHQYGSSTSSDMLSLYGLFAILDVPRVDTHRQEFEPPGAAVMIPLSPDIIVEKGPRFVTYVSGLGLLEISPTAAGGLIPESVGGGTFLSGGQLFRDSYGPRHDPFFILINQTSYTHILPDSNLNMNDILNRLEYLSVDWKIETPAHTWSRS